LSERAGADRSPAPAATAHRIRSGDVELAVEDTGGAGRPIILAHGLTATRRYVIHGSRLLERAGYRVVSYDARGHGESSAPRDVTAYGYDDLVGDLEAVIDALGIEQTVVGGSSMGAATTLVYALRHPERASALIQVTPAYRGRSGQESRERTYEWDELADALERDGVEGFMRAYGDPPVADRFKGIVERAVRARIERHRDPRTVADALRVVVRSLPFESAEELDGVRVPTLVVASRDEADPEHPFEVGEEYARRIPGAELVTEESGASPLAWRGAHLSRTIKDFLERNGLRP
jgi:pimeloyl-ACP methyl ester carboxylesterase